jgi:hypothetical protein
LINTKNEQPSSSQLNSKKDFTLGTQLLTNSTDETVEVNHALIAKRNQEWTITDESINGTYYRIPHNVPVHIPYGKLIACGLTWIDATNQNLIKIVDSSFQLLTSFVPRLDFEYIIGQGRSREHIGNRSDPVISNQHAKITFHKDSMTVIDNSDEKITSGTYISVGKEMKLTNKMQIRIGNYTFCTVRIE